VVGRTRRKTTKKNRNRFYFLLSLLQDLSLMRGSSGTRRMRWKKRRLDSRFFRESTRMGNGIMYESIPRSWPDINSLGQDLPFSSKGMGKRWKVHGTVSKGIIFLLLRDLFHEDLPDFFLTGADQQRRKKSPVITTRLRLSAQNNG